MTVNPMETPKQKAVRCYAQMDLSAYGIDKIQKYRKDIYALIGKGVEWSELGFTPQDIEKRLMAAKIRICEADYKNLQESKLTYQRAWLLATGILYNVAHLNVPWRELGFTKADVLTKLNEAEATGAI